MNTAPIVVSPTWDSATFLAKAQRYAEEMHRHERDDWRCAFWSTLTLELIARAALAKVSPALLADPNNWNNLYHALGHTPRAAKFIPKSITVTEVFNRLKEILPEFDRELENFCIVHVGNRNAELHSADTPFEGLGNSAWLPPFYRSCQVLLKSMGSSLKEFFGRAEGKVAKKLIAASVDDAAKAVTGQIKAYVTVWEEKDKDQRAELVAQAVAWATRHRGHVVDCPACKTNALVFGEPIAAPKKTIEGDTITETQQYLPSRFQCIACGLKISGLSQLSACGLGDAYKQTSTYDAAEFYAPEDEYQGYEDDNNEPA